MTDGRTGPFVQQKRAIIEPDRLERKISDLLDTFFRRRIDRLQELKLDERLGSKNPYLFKAIGVADASDIVTALLDAHISSSDETIFGNEFFEPLAKWVAEKSFEGQHDVTVQVSGAEGCDILLSKADENQAIAIKSGPKVFNAQSRGKQISEFRKIERILKKDRKLFLAIVGYCYGRKKQKGGGDFTEIAGQQLWQHLTGHSDFYLQIIHLMKLKPIEHRPQFTQEYEKAKNRFVLEFLMKYAFPDGSIDWDKLVVKVSEIATPRTVVEKPRGRIAKRKKATAKTGNPSDY
jgi:hypothetical protein